MAYNAAATDAGTRRVAAALGVSDAALGLFELAKKLGTPTSLREIGVLESDLDKAVAVTMEATFCNPEPVSAERLKQMLVNAFHGHEPGLV